MNYSFLLVFILAHLMGDFALQTDHIAKIKSTSVRGIAIHAGIITVVQTLFLSIFGLQGTLLGAACGIIHFFIDYMKGMFGRIFHKQFPYYIFDQITHFAVISLVTFLFAPSNELLPINILCIKIPIIIIVLFFASNITAQILIIDLNSEIGKKPFFKKRERLIDAFVCAAAFSLMLLPLPIVVRLLLFITGAALGYYLYAGFMRIRFSLPFNISATKYMVYVVISFAMLLFLKLG
jgi:hypothetical protein